MYMSHELYELRIIQTRYESRTRHIRRASLSSRCNNWYLYLYKSHIISTLYIYLSYELLRLDLSHERRIQAVILSGVPTEQSLLTPYTYITFPILTSRTIPFKNYTDSIYMSAGLSTEQSGPIPYTYITNHSIQELYRLYMSHELNTEQSVPISYPDITNYSIQEPHRLYMSHELNIVAVLLSLRDGTTGSCRIYLDKSQAMHT